MRLAAYATGRRASQRAFLALTRRLGAEVDDVGKVSMRRPELFGRPFLALTHTTLRGPSAWSVGERELFATVVSRANACGFCVGTHSAIASLALGEEIGEEWRDGRFGPRATATARLLDVLTRDPGAPDPPELADARAAGVDDAALAEALYVAFVFNTINRVADALAFEHRSDRDRLRGARVLRRNGYRIPRFLLR